MGGCGSREMCAWVGWFRFRNRLVALLKQVPGFRWNFESDPVPYIHLLFALTEGSICNALH